MRRAIQRQAYVHQVPATPPCCNACRRFQSIGMVRQLSYASHSYGRQVSLLRKQRVWGDMEVLCNNLRSGWTEEGSHAKTPRSALLPFAIHGRQLRTRSTAIWPKWAILCANPYHITLAPTRVCLNDEILRHTRILFFDNKKLR